MPPKSNVPIRICGSKTRSGCRTCKQRHVKCDEGRPVCLRCRKADRQCVYNQPAAEIQIRQQSSTPHQETGFTVWLAAQHRSYFQSPSPDRNISPYGPREVVEVSAVQNFAAQFGKDLAGCFSDDVWCHIFPRVAQHEPSVWHGIVAVSLLNNSIQLGYDSQGSEVQTAMKQYSKAIQKLNTRLESDDNACRKDVVLISCILFAVFECLQTNFQAALRHISGGMKLLMEWGDEAQSNREQGIGSYLNYTSLQPIFFSLDSQAVQMGVVDFRDFFSLPAMTDRLLLPTTFTTVEDANLWLNHIFNRISRWSQWVGPSQGYGTKPGDDWMEAEKQRLQAHLVEWDSAFKSTLEILHPQAATLLLLVQRRVIQALFGRDIDGPSEMEWDKYLPLFREAVDDAEAYMQLTANNSQPDTSHAEPQSESSKRPSSVLTVAMDIVLPLYLISVKCRDSAVRRRALAMLKTCGRKEGIWDSYLCAGVAEKIIELEEAAASEDAHIPENARMYSLDIRFGEDKTGEFVHKKLVQDEDGHHHTETVQEVLAW